MNTTRGVVSDDDLLGLTEAELLEGFSEQNVINVKRIRMRHDGKEVQTKHLILTFNSSVLFDSVEAGYIRLQLLGCLLRAAIKQESKDLEASHNGALQQQHQKKKDHKKLRFERSDQSEGLAQYWNNLTNFPAFSTDPMLVVAPASPCKEMWSDVARKSDSATIQCHCAMSVTPKVPETDTAHGYPSLPITAVAITRAPAVTVFAEIKWHPVRAPALVGGVWMQHKVKKTGRTAAPLCSAAFEQSSPSDCGLPDACGITSTVSPQSEGVVLRKGSNAADTSASTPRGDPCVEKEVEVENKKGCSNKKPVSPALVSGASVHHKVKRTGCTAVPLCSAAFEQSPAFDCGPPDACGVTSTVSPQSEGCGSAQGPQCG
ncbi:hypothetical protein HPB51_020203 [Rhipicephalus microplus]|uniref:Uncharacterized protein n=1 Tax=Rhipicephalus microplus TaxID=6941 RepID=A0A9J6D7U6_RHIMP|nr:hypothetical protein HPB51_020203 [Rhipicephalus microplus]